MFATDCSLSVALHELRLGRDDGDDSVRHLRERLVRGHRRHV